METKVPDLTDTWWQSRKHTRCIHVVGRLSSDGFVARYEHPKGQNKTYRISLYTLQGGYRQVAAPR